MNIVYIVLGIDSAFSSQVVGLLSQLSQSEKIHSIHLCIGLRKNELFPNIEINSKINIHIFRKYPDYPILIWNTIKELHKTLSLIQLDENTIIHTRNEMTGWVTYKALAKLKNAQSKLYVDVRGSIKEEISSFFPGSQISKFFKLILLNKIVDIYHTANSINTVSKSLKDYLVRQFEIEQLKFSTIPCLANKNFLYNIEGREEIRKKYGIEQNDIVIVFASGGINLWQNVNETVVPLAKKGVKVLNLSKHVIDHPNVISSYISYNEMPKYLSAADIGIIFREQHIVNEVASPIKFAEYLACGLPVVANDGVEQIVDVVQTYGVGTIINNIDELDEKRINNLRKINRQHIASIGQRLYSVHGIASSYISQYKKILRNDCHGQ